MTDPGERNNLVIVQRATTSADDYGHGEATWHEHARGWARVRWGSGQERREAAQETAQQAVTFEFDWTPTLAAAKPTDRLLAFEMAWDVTSRIVTTHNKEVHLTAVANLDAVVDS